MDERSGSSGVGAAPPKLLTIEMRVDVVALSGELDCVTAPALRRALAPLIRAGDCVQINARDVTFIGCAGLSVLAEAAAAVRPGGRIVLLDPSRVVRRAIDLVGLTPDLDIVGGRHQAA